MKKTPDDIEDITGYFRLAMFFAGVFLALGLTGLFGAWWALVRLRGGVHRLGLRRIHRLHRQLPGRP